jgi:hypothetical protein
MTVILLKVFAIETMWLTLPVRNRPGEAKEMKKVLLCDTLSASAMIHQLKTGVH